METKQTAIMCLCGLSEYRYNEIIFNQGIDYIKHETCDDEFYVSEIARTKLFWEWWLTVVEDRIKLFLNQFSKSPLSKNELTFIWESLLWVGSIRIYPPDIMWDAGYEQLIQTLIKHE